MKKNDEKEEIKKQDEAIIEEVIEKDADPLQEKIADLENQLKAYQDQVKRVLADYQNLEKRALQERQMWIRSANKEMILRILPVLDTLEMAGKHVQDKGLQLSIQQFISALKDEGVDTIETVGKEFDPHTMEGIATVEGAEGKVIEEVRAGYKMGDMVLRPAQVKVGREETLNTKS